MYSKENFKSKDDLIKFIGKEFAKKFGYKNLQISISGDGLYYSLKVSKDECATVYLNLFILEESERYYIYVLNKIIGKYCLFDLSEEERKSVFESSFELYQYDNIFLSMLEVSEKEVSDIVYYACNSPLEDIVIDISTVERRKMVSSFIQDYILLMKEFNQCTKDSKKWNDLNGIDWEANIIERIASSCLLAIKGKNKKLQLNYEGNWINSQIMFLNRNNSVDKLYLSIDKTNIVLYYLFFEDGIWNRKLLPNKIEDIISLFSQQAIK